MDAHRFELVAGALCLDYVNTVGDRSGTWRYVRNYLARYEDVVSWGQQAHILSEREASALRAQAQREPEAAAAAHTRAVNLREALHTVFGPIAAGRPIKRDALAPLSALLAPLLAASRLATTTEGLKCHWSFEGDALDRIIWPVARSAADLLTSGDLAYVHQCGMETCGWLFLDISKNKTRRWCSMKMCGNKAKVRHHRATRKESELR